MRSLEDLRKNGYDTAKTRMIDPEYCPNCGEKMEIIVGWNAGYQKYYLFWYCLGAVSDDSCETNGDVLSECGVVHIPAGLIHGGML